MARKYTRDNRGRFASGGGGATARGGRLRTASGNKRKTQTMSAMSGDRMSSVPQGTIGKTRKQREITMIDRPQAKRQAFNQGAAQQKAAIASRKAAPVATSKPKATSGGLRKRQGGMDKWQKEALGSAKADLSIEKERLKLSKQRKAKAAGPLERLQVQSRINEHSLNVSRATDRITRINARPLGGRPITGFDRWGDTMRNAKPSRPNTIRGKVARDPNVRAKVKGAVSLDAGKYKRLAAFNANKAAKAARRK